jgi:two-component system, OmpR family, response regulator
MRVLIVEDETEIARDIGKAMLSSGFAVEYARDGEEAWFKGSTEIFSTIILDLGLPKLDGLSVLKNWRREKITTPVIILTARGNWTDRVDGIEQGADDYLAKPFHIEELVARVRALVRRSAGVTSPVLEVGQLKLDMRSSVATRDGVKLDLGPLEFRLLAHLLLNRGKAVSLLEIGEILYGSGGDPSSNAIEALVSRLRRKIGVTVIATQRGVGYIIEADGE